MHILSHWQHLLTLKRYFHCAPPLYRTDIQPIPTPLTQRRQRHRTPGSSSEREMPAGPTSAERGPLWQSSSQRVPAARHHSRLLRAAGCSPRPAPHLGLRPHYLLPPAARCHCARPRRAGFKFPAAPLCHWPVRAIATPLLVGLKYCSSRDETGRISAVLPEERPRRRVFKEPSSPRYYSSRHPPRYPPGRCP